ncbi:helix-turn-helix domain-containing protein [Paraburkholderia tropica]|uniref:helix-turn-helix domain-containing protein n=1 Tax=Paraburkholderia tropica TaxID=92647 RepID=UPI002AB6CA96|nr:XRE family transcriptional regulator [Paraburkholderia tropica]
MAYKNGSGAARKRAGAPRDKDRKTARSEEAPAPMAFPAAENLQQPVPVKRIKSFIDLWLGEQLRMRRRTLKKSLQEVADACEISVSLLSQLERGMRSASVRTLSVLARELDTPVETLLHNTNVDRDRDDNADGALGRAGKHRRVDSGETGIHKEVLTPIAAAHGHLQLYKAVIEPGGSTGDTFFTTYSGEQVGYIIEGQLELNVGDRLYRLNTGDSFCYDSSMPRRWRNPGQTETCVLWAVSLPRAP